MNVPLDLAEATRNRAADRCQYCLMHQSLQGATFHIEHVLPKSKGGKTEIQNLALACPSCNLRKSDLVNAIDPLTGQTCSLFHPTHHRWADHFKLEGYLVVGLTMVGRTTISTLDLNSQRRLKIRAAEEIFGLFPTGT
jgi:hypothetical protein